MEKKGLKVYILTEGSSEIGFGHITRCLSIYQAFEEKGIKPKFIINGDNSITDLIKSTDFDIFNWLIKREKTFNHIKDADIVIIDSYLADKGFYETLSKVIKTPVYIDDNKRLDYPRGIVVNGNIHATDLNYPERKDIIYLLGTKYIPLRKEFWEIPEKKIRENVENIMITFGGDDIRNMTPKILKLLVEKFPDLNKKVVIGKGFKNIKEIENIADSKTQLIYYPDARKMKELMLDADIAISAGGQTLYELAAVGTPTISVIVADNQIFQARMFAKKYINLLAGFYYKMKILKNLEDYLTLLTKKHLRMRLYINSKKYISNNGAKTLIREVINVSNK